MKYNVPFSEVMKNPKNWDDEMDFDIMSENYRKLKPVMKKMFFSEYPKHPNYFVLLFSKENFADELIDAMLTSRMTDLNNIYFSEYSAEDREILISKGVYSLIPCKIGMIAVVFMKSGHDFFVCMVL